MNIKYVIKEGKPQLVVFEKDWDEWKKAVDKIWIFIHSHQHFVLRKYYLQCKNARIRHGYIEENEKLEDGVAVLVFDSTWKEHQPYIEILQQELKITIEDLPQ